MPFKTRSAMLDVPSTLPLPPGWSSAPMSEHELPELASLWLASYPLSVTDGESITSVTTDLANALHGEYGTPLEGGMLIFRGDGGRAIGAVQTVVDAPWDGAPQGPFVVELFVAPAARRVGVAHTLLALVIDVSRARGFPTVSLQVDADNTPARTLYEALGFVTSG